MGASIEWHGLEKLTSTIYNAHPKAVEQSIQVLKNNAEKGKKTARDLAPKKTGFLKDHINVTYHGMEAWITGSASYTGYQEYGTRFMSGKPHFRPMLEQITPEFQRDMTNVMKGAFR